MTAISDNTPRVVIVGAGFAGLWAAKALAGSALDVLIVDKRNYHTFLPLLYQVAAAELEPGQIAYPVRGVFRRHENIRFALAEVQGLDPESRKLGTSGPDIPYDFLLLALGSSTSYFGVEGAAEYSFGLKTLEEGIALRNHIMSCFEEASLTNDPAMRRALLTFVVVGAGPTGVEYAGALSELIRGPLSKDYPLLDLHQARVVVLEAAPHILGAFPEPLRRYGLEKLGRKGVEVRLGAQVSRVEALAAHLKDGTVLATHTVVWTAGVRGPDVAGQLGLATGPGGRVRVGETLQCPGHPEIFAIGDMAWFEGPGGALPQLAPVAMQQGRLAAENIRRHLAGKPCRAFRYRDRGAMATIGRAAAVAVFGLGSRGGTVRFTGFLAWVMWLFIHLMMLIGFRNRLAVFINWAWDYVFFERAVRLILPQGVERGQTGACPTERKEK